MKAHRREYLVLLVLLGLWALFAWRYIAPRRADRLMFEPGDFSHQFYVYRTFAYGELRAGRLPLWMDWVYSGYPLQADPQSALLYPPTLINMGLHLLLGRTSFALFALQLEALLHLFLASLLMYGFLRGEVRHRLAAMLGALTFAYGGYLTGYPLLQLPIVEGAIWLPLILWGLRGLGTGCALRRHYLAVAFGGACCVLAGHPQTYLHVATVALAYYVYRAWREHQPVRASLARLSWSGAAVLGLSAAQLWPSLQFQQLSTRTALPFEQAASGFPLGDIVQMVLPGVVSHWQPLYVGILPLILAVWGLLAVRRAGDQGFWFGLGSVALLFSFGKHLFGFDLLYLLAPGYALFHSQERLAFVVSVALSVLASYGCDGWLGPLGRRMRGRLRGLTVIAARSLPGVLIALLAALFLARVEGLSYPREAWSDRLASLLLFLGGSTALLGARLFQPRARTRLGALALALAVVDLFTLNRGTNAVAPYVAFPALPALQAATEEQAPFFRVENEGRLPGFGVGMKGLLESYGNSPIRPRNVAAFDERVNREVRWRLLGVRYFVTWRGVLERPDRSRIPAELVYREGEHPNDTYTHRLSEEPRLAWIVHDLHSVLDAESALTALNAADLDVWRSAVIQGASMASVQPAVGVEAVRLVSRAPDRIHLQASLSSPGVLVLSQASYPGWEVSVNGVRVPLLEVDALLPAVALPTGDADVVFRYRPLSFYGGAAISLATLLAILAVCLVAGRTVMPVPFVETGPHDRGAIGVQGVETT